MLVVEATPGIQCLLHSQSRKRPTMFPRRLAVDQKKPSDETPPLGSCAGRTTTIGSAWETVQDSVSISQCQAPFGNSFMMLCHRLILHSNAQHTGSVQSPVQVSDSGDFSDGH